MSFTDIGIILQFNELILQAAPSTLSIFRINILPSDKDPSVVRFVFRWNEISCKYNTLLRVVKIISIHKKVKIEYTVGSRRCK